MIISSIYKWISCFQIFLHENKSLNFFSNWETSNPPLLPIFKVVDIILAAVLDSYLAAGVLKEWKPFIQSIGMSTSGYSDLTRVDSIFEKLLVHNYKFHTCFGVLKKPEVYQVCKCIGSSHKSIYIRYYLLEKCLPSVLQSPIVLSLDIFIRSLLLLFCTHFWRNRCPYPFSGLTSEICLCSLLFWRNLQ